MLAANSAGRTDNQPARQYESKTHLAKGHARVEQVDKPEGS